MFNHILDNANKENPLRPSFTPGPLLLDDLSTLRKWQLWILHWLEKEPIMQGDGLWIWAKSASGKSTFFKYITCRYQKKCFKVGRHAASGQPSSINFESYRGPDMD